RAATRCDRRSTWEAATAGFPGARGARRPRASVDASARPCTRRSGSPWQRPPANAALRGRQVSAMPEGCVAATRTIHYTHTREDAHGRSGARAAHERVGTDGSDTLDTRARRLAHATHSAPPPFPLLPRPLARLRVESR